MSNVISVKNLGKKYIITHQQREQYSSLRDTITSSISSFGKRLTTPFLRRSLQPCSDPLSPAIEDFWALKDVSFEVKQGDRIGIIGRNGAGKSTLLKLLSRITDPTTGSIRIKGRVASLLEVGTGFHPELTGRENIYLNGAILGMQREEIRRKFEEIVDFSEIEKFLDTPVKRYSSGMYLRLAFAVAAHLEPEILIVDEVLAVGDAQFQKKCMGKMEEVGREGRTVLFVSHNMGAIKALCQRGVFIREGRVEYIGDIEPAVSTYLNLKSSKQFCEAIFKENYQLTAQILTIEVLDTNNNLAKNHPYDMPFFVKITLGIHSPISSAYVAVHIHDSDMQTIVFSRKFIEENCDEESWQRGSYKYLVKIPAPLLIPGSYSVSVHLASTLPNILLDGVDSVCPFELVDTGSIYAKKGLPWRGKLSIPLIWDVLD